MKKVRCGLLPQAGPPAREGAEISEAGKGAVGTITSGTMSPVLRKNIAMGYVEKPFNKSGTELSVTTRGKSYPAVVAKMPFVPTKYFKPE